MLLEDIRAKYGNYLDIMPVEWNQQYFLSDWYRQNLMIKDRVGAINTPTYSKYTLFRFITKMPSIKNIL